MKGKERQMLKYVIYDADGIQVAEHECELLAVCGFSRPGIIAYNLMIDFAAAKHEAFACLCHLSVQLQVAAREAMLDAKKIAEENGIELDDEFYKTYEDAVYGLEKQMEAEDGEES